MSPRPGLADQVSFLCRLILNIRLYVLLLTIIWVGPEARADPLLPITIVLTALASFIPLWRWDQLAGSMLRRPTFLAADVVVAISLLALTGTQGPVLHFALTTAALAGLLRGGRGAVVVTLTLVAGYELIAQAGGFPGGVTFQTLIGAPALLPMAAASGMSVRVLLNRQAKTEAALDLAVQTAAAGEERTRLAREMHDSLNKTLQGVVLSATALQGWAVRDPARVSVLAQGVAEASREAAAQARELISDLRGDRLDTPLGEAIRDYLLAWSQRTGVEAEMRGHSLDEVVETVGWSPGVRYEIFAILKEALANVERHAAGANIAVRIRDDGDAVSVTLSDDGVGFARPVSYADLAREGHYGIVGMAERAERIGGQFDLRSWPGRGTSIEIRVPRSRPPEQDSAPLPATPLWRTA